MPAPSLDPVVGHKTKYETLKAMLPADKVGAEFVGGADPLLVGLNELEIIRRFSDPNDKDVVDLGCGIGRLTRHLLKENVRSYLGTDVVEPILQDAIDLAKGHDNFRFELVNDCRIPASDASADIVTAFSVITHLIDEQVYEYVSEARRVLRRGGVAIFTFLDFENPVHLERFFAHVKHFRHGHGDLMKFTSRDILKTFAIHAGFDSRTEIMEADQSFLRSGKTSEFIDVSSLPPTFMAGQAVIVMRVTG